MKLRGQHLMITGSNRGIGLEVAYEAARRGAHLHLVNRTLNPVVKADCLKLGAASVVESQLDLTKRSDIEKFIASKPEVDILFNNSGQLTADLLEQQKLDDIYNLIQVNVTALIHLTHGLLPAMLKKKRGMIVNHASVAAFMTIPLSSSYSASKAAVYAFSESLKIELGGTGVEVLVLITPLIETRMGSDARVKMIDKVAPSTSAMSPDRYAMRVCNAIEKGEDTLSPQGSSKWGVILARRWPGVFRKVIGRRFDRSAQVRS